MQRNSKSARSERAQQIGLLLTLGISVSLHGGLLWLPVPEPETTPEQSEPETLDAIALLSLPPAVSPAAEVPEVAGTVAGTPPPPPSPISPSPSPALDESATAMIAPMGVEEPDRAEVTDSMPTSTPTSPGKTPPKPEPSPEPPPPTGREFPHYEGARSGCYGSDSCHQVTGGTLHQVRGHLLEQLKAQGYQITERDDLTDTGVRIYALEHEEHPPQYLSILSDNAHSNSVYYVIRDEAITSLAELRSLPA